MTAAVATGARSDGPLKAGFAAVAAGSALLLVVGQEHVRRLEAAGSAALVTLTGVAPADALGTAVTFPVGDRLAGFTVAPGCTAALLVAPFFVVAGVLLAAGRVEPGKAATTVALFAAVVIVVNQLRLLVIAAAMRTWGYPVGFDRSHVLMGSFVSTIGVAGGLLLFLRMVVPRRRDEATT